MYCLNKLQTLLTKHLNIPIPENVQELLAKNGYSGIQKGQEFIPLEIKLTPEQIENVITRWDLSPKANAKHKQSVIIETINPQEANTLSQEFNFKHNNPLVREIDSHQVIHALKQHGDAEKEAQRGQIAITIKDISNYQNIIKDHDLRIIQDNNRILYAKQINGHYIVIEEALQGQDKLRFFDIWKQKGKLNKEVLLSHSQRPDTTPSLKLDSYMPNKTDDILPHHLKWTQEANLLESILELSGEKYLIQKDSFNNFYIQSTKEAKAPRSYDEARVQEALSEYEKIQIEQRVANNIEHSVLLPSSADLENLRGISQTPSLAHPLNSLKATEQGKQSLEYYKQGESGDSSLKTQTPEQVQQVTQALYQQAQAQEASFKTLLQSFNHKLAIKDDKALKSLDSIQSKAKRKQGDISQINDYLRGAVIAKDNRELDNALKDIVASLENQGIKPTIELKHTKAGYKGLHVQFDFNGVPSEIQLHTKSSWAIKKRQDEIYHKLRENNLSTKEREKLIKDSQALSKDLEFSINDFTSFEVSAYVSGSAKSVLRPKFSFSTQASPISSNSPSLSNTPTENAYTRPDHSLRQKELNLSKSAELNSLIHNPFNKDNPIISQPHKKSLVSKQDTQQIQQEIEAQELREAQSEQRYQEAKARQEAILKEKEANLNKRADEKELNLADSIDYKPIRNTKIIISDDIAPLNAEYAIININDIKPNFTKTQTQGRVVKQDAVIENIIKDFKPDLLIPREGGADGLPIITKDGQVISGNHRAEALKTILGNIGDYTTQSNAYKEAIKDFLDIDLHNGEMVVRRVKDNVSSEDILKLAFSSNKGRESTMGEKALSNLSYFKDNIPNLPQRIDSQNVEELKAIVANILDKQGGGLDTLNTNLALLAHISPNTKNADIIGALDSIGGDAKERVKLINMFIDNAGSFYNLSQNKILSGLDIRPYLSEAIVGVSKSSHTRALDLQDLFLRIDNFLNAGEKGREAILILDPERVNNLISHALSISLAKFARQENPSVALYDSLKAAPQALEELTQPTLLSEGKPLSEVDIYDFVSFLLQEGQVTKQVSDLIEKLEKLRELEKGLKGSEAKEVNNAQAQKELSQAENTEPPSEIKQEASQAPEIDKELSQEWLKTFNLKSLKDDFIPSFTPEVKEVLNAQGIKEIHLKSGSLVKLEKEHRVKYLDRIKPTLENPDRIILQDENTIIFAKDFNDKKYFTSVARDSNNQWIVVSNAPKSENGLNNKLSNGGKELYNKNQASGQINATATYDDIAKSYTKLDNPIITQPEIKAKNDLMQRKESTLKLLENAQKELDIAKERGNEKEIDFLQRHIRGLELEVREIDSSYGMRPTLSPKQKAVLNNKIKKTQSALRGVKRQIQGGKLLNLYKTNPEQAKKLESMLTHKEELLEKEQWGYTKELWNIPNIPDEIIALKKLDTEDIKLAQQKMIFLKELEAQDETFKARVLNTLGSDPAKVYTEHRAYIAQAFFKDKNYNKAPELGENYIEYYRDPQGAISHLLKTKSGQVRGAFYRDDLGDITLAWGEVTDKANHKGYGLAHIIDKHPELDLNIINKAISKGEFLNDKGINTILYTKDNVKYRIGLAKGWENKDGDYWILTAYEVESPRTDSLPSKRDY